MTNRPTIGPMLRTALGVSSLLSPLARPILRRRLARGKEDPDRWREKLGEASAARPAGPLVWMHGVGVGEVMALRGLVTAMAEKRPDLNFLVTSSARSSGDVFARNLPARTQHQYLPLDMPGPVARFLGHWQPDLAVWSDQEIWPRLAVTCARRGIPQALVAGRLTHKSATLKARFGDAYGDLYRLLDLRLVQDDRTADTLRHLMDDDTPVLVTGSLKAAAAPLADDPALAATLPKDRPIWLAASAHRADIDAALRAQAASDTDRLLIIAPRDLSDADYIVQSCRDLGLTQVQRSRTNVPDATTSVFIADTFGELGIWYRAAFAALIGGTFDATEGHNPWEGVALGCAILHGPRTGNFATDFDQLSGANAARLVPDPADLGAALASPELPEMAQRAHAVRASASRAMGQTADALDNLIKD